MKEIENHKNKNSKYKLPKINDNITCNMVRIVSESGDIEKVITKEAAIAMSISRGLDLVELSSNSDISVCKIMDYGKYKYAQKKKNAQAKKNQKIINTSTTIKEIKLRINIELGDYNTKIKQIHVFLEKGYKVKITIKFRGREMANQSKGKELLQRIVTDEAIKNILKIEKQPEKQGNQIFTVLSRK